MAIEAKGSRIEPFTLLQIRSLCQPQKLNLVLPRIPVRFACFPVHS